SGGPPVVSRTGIDRRAVVLARSLDGRTLWAARGGSAPAAADTVRAYGLSATSRLSLVAGGNQIGPPGSVLPIPVRVQVTDASGNPQAGSVVTFSLPDTSNGRITGATSAEHFTDPLGEAQVAWTMPGSVRSATMTISAPGVAGSLTAAAESATDPAAAVPV